MMIFKLYLVSRHSDEIIRTVMATWSKVKVKGLDLANMVTACKELYSFTPGHHRNLIMHLSAKMIWTKFC